jgi:hypothetical protein
MNAKQRAAAWVAAAAVALLVSSDDWRVALFAVSLFALSVAIDHD